MSTGLLSASDHMVAEPAAPPDAPRNLLVAVGALVGLLLVPATCTPRVPVTGWLCIGMLLIVSMVFSVPPISPIVRGVRPPPLPWLIGIRPLRFGSPNVVCPLPP